MPLICSLSNKEPYLDLTNKQIHFVGYVSSIEGTLNRADSIISLAEKNSETAGTLAACATIILAVALEQGVQTVLTESAEWTSFEDDIDVSDTKAMPYYKNKNNLWYKVQSLPSILTDDKFYLNFDHSHSKLLKELIHTRNKLVHIDEQAIHLIGPNNQVRIENNHAIVEFFVPLTPWQNVTLEKVKSFREAVAVYLREVLFPESGKIIEGTIVTAAS
jgi:hypothetical protein